jgi:regulator of protease activity HflC (stomatin/prohibitin superfamily)
MADLGLTDKESSTVSSILASELDTKIDELYESTYKDKVGGMTDAEVQKAYAEAMKYSEAIDNQSGNKAKYYNEDGSEVGVISDIVARRYLAEQKAYEELGKSVEKVSKKFKELAKSTNIYDKALGKFISTRDFTSMT